MLNWNKIPSENDTTSITVPYQKKTDAYTYAIPLSLQKNTTLYILISNVTTNCISPLTIDGMDHQSNSFFSLIFMKTQIMDKCTSTIYR